MVNVGGRSKGCSTCRKRRVKCDETRPTCLRCQRSGYGCTGAKETAFIEGTIVKSRRTEKRTSPPVKLDVVDVPTAQKLPLVSQPMSNAFEICVEFSRKHFRRDGPLDVALQDTQVDDLIRARTSTSNDQVFQQSMLSFVILVFGTHHGHVDIVNQGYVMRGFALKQLNQALSVSKCYARDDVILSVIALAILECLVPTGPQHYLQHMIGLERLLELRGPDETPSPKAADLYKSVRHMILFASLRTRRPSILARPEWKKVLKQVCSEREIQEQDLYSVLADCTVLMAEQDNILARWELDLAKSIQRRERVQSAGHALLSQVHSWKKRWDSDPRNTYSERPTPFERSGSMKEARRDITSPFLTSLEFEDHFASINCMFYHTTLIYVLRILNFLPPDYSAKQVLTNRTLDQTGHLKGIRNHEQGSYAAAEWQAASEVCRCVPYYMIQSSQLEREASPIGHWAIMTAWMTFRGRESAEGRWMIDLLKGRTQVGVIAQALWAE